MVRKKPSFNPKPKKRDTAFYWFISLFWAVVQISGIVGLVIFLFVPEFRVLKALIFAVTGIKL